MKTWSLTAALILVLAIPLPATAGKPPGAAGTVSNPAPPFNLPGRTGAVVLDSLRGKLVLVDFWASWCGPCQQSFPWMAEMYQRYAAKGFTIVAVNLDKDRDQAEKFLAKRPVSFPVAFDPSGKTAKEYKVWGMPTSYLVSPTGEILSAHMGFDPRHAAAFEAEIQKGCPQ